MIPRQELQDLVQRRLKEAISSSDMERLISEINSLEERGWEELSLTQLDTSREVPLQCFDCWLEDQLRQGAEIRLYLKKPPCRGSKGATTPAEKASQHGAHSSNPCLG
jgi:hypothetical protein